MGSLFVFKIYKNELKIEKKIQIVVYVIVFLYLCSRKGA